MKDIYCDNPLLSLQQEIMELPKLLSVFNEEPPNFTRETSFKKVSSNSLVNTSDARSKDLLSLTPTTRNRTPCHSWILFSVIETKVQIQKMISKPSNWTGTDTHMHVHGSYVLWTGHLRVWPPSTINTQMLRADFKANPSIKRWAHMFRPSYAQIISKA